jgi:excisionase family DNA binding protein
VNKTEYTVGEVATRVGVSVKTVRRAIACGHLRVMKFNGRVFRVEEQALREWLDAVRLGTLSTTRTK